MYSKPCIVSMLLVMCLSPSSFQVEYNISYGSSPNSFKHCY
ncbi:hypothetical protein GLYMA_14G207151v4 [Glycine max]|nr:hypothetical protein GLYMA_14G207151v4 [Glycine max]KAH1095528.1 hypothetical protein GYH30_040692 [Glycine max]